jgi:hypothetical protein
MTDSGGRAEAIRERTRELRAELGLRGYPTREDLEAAAALLGIEVTSLNIRSAKATRYFTRWRILLPEGEPDPEFLERQYIQEVGHCLFSPTAPRHPAHTPEGRQEQLDEDEVLEGFAEAWLFPEPDPADPVGRDRCERVWRARTSGSTMADAG